MGSYPNITISVSDGTASASLAPFTLTVMSAPVTTGNATLNWTRPTLNSDGTMLSAVSGYKIYYGASASSLSNSISVSGDVTSYTISNLAKGTWYFAIASINSAGIEGSRSNNAASTL